MAGLHRFACVLVVLLVSGCSSAPVSSAGGNDGSIDDRGAGAQGGTGTGAGGQGGSAVCGCGGGLAIDVEGDDDPLHLTSGDYRAVWQSNAGVAIDADITHDMPLAGCLDQPRPWAEETTGGGSILYWAQACAGPGDAPPCIWLAANIGYSRYVDRDGHSFVGDLKQLSTTFQSFETEEGESIDGQFTMVLDDGRTLTGTLRVCVLAALNFG